MRSDKLLLCTELSNADDLYEPRLVSEAQIKAFRWIMKHYPELRFLLDYQTLSRISRIEAGECEDEGEYYSVTSRYRTLSSKEPLLKAMEKTRVVPQAYEKLHNEQTLNVPFLPEDYQLPAILPQARAYRHQELDRYFTVFRSKEGKTKVLQSRQDFDSVFRDDRMIHRTRAFWVYTPSALPKRQKKKVKKPKKGAKIRLTDTNNSAFYTVGAARPNVDWVVEPNGEQRWADGNG